MCFKKALKNNAFLNYLVVKNCENFDNKNVKRCDNISMPGYIFTSLCKNVTLESGVTAPDSFFYQFFINVLNSLRARTVDEKF